MTTLTVRRFSTRSALDAALERRLAAVLTTTADGPPAAIMLSGGTTPMAAYGALAQHLPAHGAGLELLFSDERYVPADSQASNYHQSRALIDALQLPSQRLLRVNTELPLPQAADDYQQRLQALMDAGVPVQLALLGLGPDGHTASLFTAADLARAHGRLAIAVQRPDGMSGVSVTPQFLAYAHELMFVVAGSGKQQAIRRLIAGDPTLTAWQAVQGLAAVELWLDAEAEQA